MAGLVRWDRSDPFKESEEMGHRFNRICRAARAYNAFQRGGPEMKRSSRSLWVTLLCSVFVLSLSIGTAVAQSSKSQKDRRIEKSDNRTRNRMQNIVREVRHELIMLPYYN